MMSRSVAVAAVGILICVANGTAPAAEPVDIGSRLELFVDRYLIDEFTGDVQLQLHEAKPKEVVLVTDEPWEGNTCAYYTIFQDGDLYRMYYRGSHFDERTRKPSHREVTCYAESKDGIHWTKPKLGLFDFEGSKQNNIVWDGIGTHCFTPFKDRNPGCSPDARYKAISRGRPRGKKGLYAFKSADGIHWSLMSDEPVITTGAFDSQNLAFWDPHTKRYLEFHRTFSDGVRAIMTGTSDDFLNWSKPVLLKYPGSPSEHLYTNAIRPYVRAPHILIGFPTRYLPKHGSRVEPIFMSSRDGRTFHRFPAPVIREDAPKDRGGNRSNYMTWGLVQLPGDEEHFSVYATEAYYTGPDSRVRRFTFRVDGFVSARAAGAGGELLTKPLKFDGKQLIVNFVTSEKGSLRVELQDIEGHPIKSFNLKGCAVLRGDAVDQRVTWKSGKNLSVLAGKPIRIRFHLKDADLFSFSFRP
jgi:hypothetical protein